MRVLFLANAASVHTVRWVNALSERGNEVHLVYKSDDEPRENIISPKIVLHKLKYSGSKGYFLNAVQLRKIFILVKPHIVNAHYASGYGTLARIARLKPLILSVWGSDVYDFPYQSRLKMKIVIDNLKFADRIASTSKIMAEQVKSLLNEKGKFVAITPFGIDLSMFSRTENILKDEIIIGNIKSLKEVYGLDYLINSIKILKNNLEKKEASDLSDRIRLYIYGDGPEKEKLTNLINQLDLNNTVLLKGKIPNNKVPKALELIDIFCATSIQESFGVSLLEAMAMELPIVATNVPGFLEIVDNYSTGVIVESRNAESIAKALEMLVIDKDLRISMGKQGRNKVEKFYDWKENVNLMISLYIDTIKDYDTW